MWSVKSSGRISGRKGLTRSFVLAVSSSSVLDAGGRLEDFPVLLVRRFVTLNLVLVGLGGDRERLPRLSVLMIVFSSSFTFKGVNFLLGDAGPA